MLTKIIFSFTIVFFYLSLQGQEKNIYIEYENKLVSTQETTGILIAGKSNAKYTENPSAKKGEMSIERSFDGHAAVYKPDVKEYHFYKAKGLPVIYYTEYLVRDKTPHYVYDSIPKLSWEYDAAKEGVNVRIGDRPKINKRPNMVEKIYEWEKEGDIWLFYIDYFKKHPDYKINNL